MERSDYLNEKVRNDILLLDLITGEGLPDADRGAIIDEARFVIYEEIHLGRINDNNFSDYVELYQRLCEDDDTTEDNGQVLFSSIPE